MSAFDRVTAVTPLGGGRYGVEIDPGWQIRVGPNGGYLAAMLLRSATHELADAAYPPRSLSLHYLRPAQPGPAVIEVETVRAGRTVTAMAVRLLQGDVLRVTGMATFSRRREAPQILHHAMPDVPPPDRLPRNMPQDSPLRAQLEQRLALGALPRSGADEARAGGWMRLADGPRALDAPLLALYCDVWPPAVLSWAGGERDVGAVPTVDLSIHFRSDLADLCLPDDAYVLVHFHTHTAREGYLVEDGEVWSADGQLLAQARQMALMG